MRPCPRYRSRILRRGPHQTPPRDRGESSAYGLPTLQWDNPIGVIYCKTSPAVIWELEVKLKKDHWGSITWETIAEDADISRGDWALYPMQFAEAGKEQKPYKLVSKDVSFGKSTTSKSKEA